MINLNSLVLLDSVVNLVQFSCPVYFLHACEVLSLLVLSSDDLSEIINVELAIPEFLLKVVLHFLLLSQAEQAIVVHRLCVFHVGVSLLS